jgi:23S rRNA (uracil1939-C5)-methyltransferase
MPGDCVDVKIRLEKKDVIFATVLEYLDSSDISILPGCDAFGGEHACGGCDWLMVPYNTQVYWKTELMKQVFEPLQLQDKVCNTVASPQSQHYRNKSFLPAGENSDWLYFGMYERYSHNVVPHKRCLLQPAVMDEILDEIVSFGDKVRLEAYNETTHSGNLRHVGIRINQTQDEILVILVTKGSKFPFTGQLVRTLTAGFPQITGIIQNINRSIGNVILGDEEKLLYGTPYINDELNGIRFRLHYKSFYQINSATTLLMYKHIKDSLKATDTVLDAFCGVGTIGLFVADQIKAVHGIEEVPEAIADAEFNQELNNIKNSAFHLGKVEEVLPRLMLRYPFTTVILDPPRKGVDTPSLLTIAKEKIPQIIYVSCNPMTLARDVRVLLDNGYKVDSITPFDMFPQTWHIEAVARLSFVQE